MKAHLYFAGFFGLTGVALGAFGAHALKATLAASNSAPTWQTAVLYQFIHALAILAVALNRQLIPKSALGWYSKACASWTLGVFLFSGSLYWLATGGPRWLGPITPLGGVALIIGWVFLLIGASKSQSDDNKSAS
ncbi:MAG: DUF423 domain-containing protein [Rariglobus sp.]